MFCGFIFEDYRMKMANLDNNKIREYCEDDKYISINMKDYYIFVSKELDKDELQVYLTHLNAELLRTVNIVCK